MQTISPYFRFRKNVWTIFPPNFFRGEFTKIGTGIFAFIHAKQTEQAGFPQFRNCCLVLCQVIGLDVVQSSTEQLSWNLICRILSRPGRRQTLRRPRTIDHSAFARLSRRPKRIYNVYRSRQSKGKQTNGFGAQRTDKRGRPLENRAMDERTLPTQRCCYHRGRRRH